jgi:VWFA-related protein
MLASPFRVEEHVPVAKRQLAFILLGTWFTAVALIHGQESSPVAPVPQLRARGVDQKQDASVLMNAVVLDGKGKGVKGLQEQDFNLLDDRKKVPQASWQLLTSGTPVSQSPQIIFVLDAVNSSLPDLARIEDAMEQYLKEGNAPLAQRTTILFVSDAPPQAAASQHSPDKAPTSADNVTTMALEQKQLSVHRTPTSTDRNALLHALESYKAGMPRLNDAQGATIQSDQVRLSLQALNYIASAYTSIKGPKLVLWLGPGWPFLAKSSAKSSEPLFDSVVYFTSLLQEAQITLYSISPEGVTAGDTSSEMGSFELAQRASSGRSFGAAPPPNVPTELNNSAYAAFLNGVRTMAQSNPNDLAVQVLAFHTGGLVLRRNNDLVAQIERCIADASGMYVFSHKPEKGRKPDIYHDLAIETANGSRRVRTLTGFYAR